MKRKFYTTVIVIMSLITLIGCSGTGVDVIDDVFECENCHEEIDAAEAKYGPAEEVTRMDFDDGVWVENHWWWSKGINLEFWQWDDCTCEVNRFEFEPIPDPVSDDPTPVVPDDSAPSTPDDPVSDDPTPVVPDDLGTSVPIPSELNGIYRGKGVSTSGQRISWIILIDSEFGAVAMTQISNPYDKVDLEYYGSTDTIEHLFIGDSGDAKVTFYKLYTSSTFHFDGDGTIFTVSGDSFGKENFLGQTWELEGTITNGTWMATVYPNNYSICTVVFDDGQTLLLEGLYARHPILNQFEVWMVGQEEFYRKYHGYIIPRSENSATINVYYDIPSQASLRWSGDGTITK